MSLPAKLKKFNLFNDANSYLGVVEEVTLPKLAWKTEEYEGAGMVGPVDIPMTLDKLEMEWTAAGLVPHGLKQFGICGLAGVPLRFNGAYQANDTCAVQAGELLVRGYHREIDMGSAKQGDNTQHKFTTALSYLKWSLDNVALIEIDMINGVFIVDGTDRYADFRKAMGL